MKKMVQRALIASCIGWGLAGPSAQAAWPDDKAIELVVGFAPGGGTDVMARNLARFMEKRLGDGARIVVVNKPGAGGEIAATHVQNASPDGYTLGMVNVPGYVFLPMYRKTSYQPENLRLLARIVDDPAMLVAHKGSGKPLNLTDFVSALKKDPGGLSVGHPGDGTTGHLGILQLNQLAGVDINAIPFKGAGESKVALLGQHVDYIVITTGEAVEMAQTGSPMVGVALMGKQRAANGVPTAKEQGLEVLVSSERGMAAPKQLPDAIAMRIQDAIEQTLQDPDFLKAATADAPVLAFLPGPQWEQALLQLRTRLEPLVPLMAQ